MLHSTRRFGWSASALGRAHAVLFMSEVAVCGKKELRGQGPYLREESLRDPLLRGRRLRVHCPFLNHGPGTTGQRLLQALPGLLSVFNACVAQLLRLRAQQGTARLANQSPAVLSRGRGVVSLACRHDLERQQAKGKRLLRSYALGDGDLRRGLGPLRLGISVHDDGRPLSENYRHEFGSLLDVEAEAEFQRLGDEQKELVLHLIAAHHGRGRPHFRPEEAFDPEPKGKDVATIAAEVPRRFARLQRKYGRWGLAYVESLLRAADYAASARPSSFAEERK